MHFSTPELGFKFPAQESCLVCSYTSEAEEALAVSIISTRLAEMTIQKQDVYVQVMYGPNFQ